MTTPQEFVKTSEETLDNYLLRLGNNKDLYELSWQKIADLMNFESNEDFGESKWRKDYYLIKKGYDLAIKSNVSGDEVIKEMYDQSIELQKEKFKVMDQRREYRNLIRPEARFEQLHEDIINVAKQLSDSKPLSWEKKYFHNSDIEGALLLSDFHKGLFAQNYWNKFDNAEFYRRIERVVEKTIQHGKNNDVKTLHVFSLGDLVNGLIHVTTRINSVEDVITQTMSVAEAMAEILTKLANEFEEIKFYQCRGNHDRVTPNKSDELEKESFADIIVWFLKSRLAHVQNIEFKENTYDDEIIDAEICGYKILAVHGHRDRITNVVDNLTQMTKVFADYIFLGHVHHHEENETHSTEVIINSSLSGVDSYAKQIRKTSKPAQKLIIFSKEESRLCTYNIRLDR